MIDVEKIRELEDEVARLTDHAQKMADDYFSWATLQIAETVQLKSEIAQLKAVNTDLHNEIKRLLPFLAVHGMASMT